MCMYVYVSWELLPAVLIWNFPPIPGLSWVPEVCLKTNFKSLLGKVNLVFCSYCLSVSTGFSVSLENFTTFRFVLRRPRKDVLSGFKNTRALFPSPRSRPTRFASCHLKHLMPLMKVPNNFRESGALKITGFQDHASCRLTSESPVPPLVLVMREK